MNPRISKVATLAGALLAMVLSSLGFASALSKGDVATERLQHKQGCMMCHQGESTQFDETPEK